MEVDTAKSVATFNEIDKDNLQSRQTQLKLKQASIAQRLLLVKREMFRLDKELRAQNELPEQAQSEIPNSS
jgi:hypothetical protein